MAKEVGRKRMVWLYPLFSKEEDNYYGYWEGSKAGRGQESDGRRVLWMDVILLRVSGRDHVGLEQQEYMGEKIRKLELQLRLTTFLQLMC